MGVDFYIVGGALTIPKKVFIKEMLSPGSTLTRLLNFELEAGDKKRVLTIEKTSNLVHINFTQGSNVKIDEDYRALLEKLKMKYKEKVKGEIQLMGQYHTTFFVRLDLNSEDASIRELH